MLWKAIGERLPEGHAAETMALWRMCVHRGGDWLPGNVFDGVEIGTNAGDKGGDVLGGLLLGSGAADREGCRASSD